MKYTLFLIVALLTLINVYSQDSIVNYLDNKGNVVEKDHAAEIETLVKKDTLWQVTKYYRNGKVKTFGHFKNKDKKHHVGEFINYHHNGQVSTLLQYNNVGKKNGRFQTWFNNGKLSSFGIYISDQKESAWKYYHYNGVEASRLYYKNDSILKVLIFDDAGKQISVDLIENINAKYKGGKNKFNSEIQKLTRDISYKVKGKIHVHFVVGIHGEIQDVAIAEELPKELNRQIVTFFEAIEGWEPAIHMNRKIPINFTVPLYFNAH